jgi:predicted nucleic acid-binding protein
VIIVSDTTPLSELAKVGRINLLQDIFGKVIIPQEVYNEIIMGNHPAVSLVQNADWIEIQAVRQFKKTLGF